MDKQNVTLSIPKDVLLKAKLLAVTRRTSLSGLLTDMLLDIVAQEDRYLEAQRHHLAWLKHGADLGTNGHINWTRDDLHER